MIVWVLYDIENDQARTKIAKLCKQMGLYRVQYSVFLGQITESEKDTLEIEISDLMNQDKDSVYVFPMSKQELKDTTLLGQAFDKQFVTDEVKTLFF